MHVAEIHQFDQVAVAVPCKKERVPAGGALGAADDFDTLAHKIVVPLLGVAHVQREVRLADAAPGHLHRGLLRLEVEDLENGAAWVRPLLEAMAQLWKKQPQAFAENPVEVVQRNIHVSPFWEEDLPALAGLLGEDRVCFGSDYPHPEGLASPRSYLDELSGASEELVAKIMGGNLARLMGLPAEVPARA